LKNAKKRYTSTFLLSPVLILQKLLDFVVKKDRNLYEIKKNNLIPKVKVERELGILEKLGWGTYE